MLTFRRADANDVDLFYSWANDPETRNNSYNKNPIVYSDHVAWFNRKINSDNCWLYVFQDEQANPVGQVRIEKSGGEETIISISIGKDHRGKGYASEMLAMASGDYLSSFATDTIIAYVFTSNEPSLRSFIKAGYILKEERPVKGIPSYILSKGPAYVE